MYAVNFALSILDVCLFKEIYLQAFIAHVTRLVEISIFIRTSHVVLHFSTFKLLRCPKLSLPAKSFSGTLTFLVFFANRQLRSSKNSLPSHLYWPRHPFPLSFVIAWKVASRLGVVLFKNWKQSECCQQFVLIWSSKWRHCVMVSFFQIWYIHFLMQNDRGNRLPNMVITFQSVKTPVR